MKIEGVGADPFFDDHLPSISPEQVSFTPGEDAFLLFVAEKKINSGLLTPPMTTI